MKQISLLILLFSTTAFAQDLSRRAKWETSFNAPSQKPGAIIKSVNNRSPMQKAGLKKGDIILQVNGKPANSVENWTSITYSLRSNVETELLVRRGSRVLSKSIVLNPLPLEEHHKIDTYYESLTSDYGISQRIIITKPQGTERRLPAIFLVQGLSCSSIETYSGGGNWVKQINSIVENSGMVVIRVEKPGVGDSGGDCAETDFITELEGYRAAIRSLKQKSYVDTTKIVIYGSSMGSALAPLLANEFGLAGVISDGVFFKTWFEHMLEIERRIRQMSGDNESTIAQKMNEAYIPLYYGMLIQKKSYEEVIEEYPAIAKYNYHSAKHMYGRPMKYYQQLQDFDLAGEWEKLKVPVRILYGTNDWIMSEFDNIMIIDVLDRAGHQDHKLHLYPGMDHWNTIHETLNDSFYGEPGKWDSKMPELIIEWAKEILRF